MMESMPGWHCQPLQGSWICTRIFDQIREQEFRLLRVLINNKISWFDDQSFSLKGHFESFERTLAFLFYDKHDTMGASSSKSAPAVADNISQLIGMFFLDTRYTLGLGFLTSALWRRNRIGVLFCPSGGNENVWFLMLRYSMVQAIRHYWKFAWMEKIEGLSLQSWSPWSLVARWRTVSGWPWSKLQKRKGKLPLARRP